MSSTPASTSVEIGVLRGLKPARSHFGHTGRESGKADQLRANRGGPSFWWKDNDSLRELTEVLLSEMGFRVIACPDAENAAQVFVTDSSGSIDLLLTDIEMPGASGIDLARELTRLRPSLPVLIVSGSLVSSDLTREMEDRSWRFVSKPFRPPTLLDAVQELLPSSKRPHSSNFEGAMPQKTSAPEIVRVQHLLGSGLKVYFSDDTCAFLTLDQIAAIAAVRQLRSTTWPADKALAYCCYEGCESCS